MEREVDIVDHTILAEGVVIESGGVAHSLPPADGLRQSMMDELGEAVTSMQLLDLLGISRAEFHRNNGFGIVGQIIDGRMTYTKEQAMIALSAVQSIKATVSAPTGNEVNSGIDVEGERVGENSDQDPSTQDEMTLSDLLRFLNISRMSFYRYGRLGITGRLDPSRNRALVFTRQEALSALDSLERILSVNPTSITGQVVPDGFISRDEILNEPGITREKLRRLQGYKYRGRRVYYSRSDVEVLRREIDDGRALIASGDYVSTKEARGMLSMSNAAFYANVRPLLTERRINNVSYFSLQEVKNILKERAQQRVNKAASERSRVQGSKRKHVQEGKPAHESSRQISRPSGPNPFLDVSISADHKKAEVATSLSAESDRISLVDFGRENFQVLESDQLAVVELTLGFIDGIQHTIDEAARMLGIKPDQARDLDREGVMRLRAERTRLRALNFTVSETQESKLE